MTCRHPYPVSPLHSYGPGPSELDASHLWVNACSVHEDARDNPVEWTSVWNRGCGQMVSEGADGRLDRIACTLTRVCWNLLAVIGLTMLGCLLGLVLAPGSAEAATIQNAGTHGARIPVTDALVTQLALVASFGPTSPTEYLIHGGGAHGGGGHGGSGSRSSGGRSERTVNGNNATRGNHRGRAQAGTLNGHARIPTTARTAKTSTAKTSTATIRGSRARAGSTTATATSGVGSRSRGVSPPPSSKRSSFGSLTARGVSDHRAIGRTATGRHDSRPKEAPLLMLTSEYVPPPTAPTEPYGPWNMVQNLPSLVEGGAPGADGGIAVLLCAAFLMFSWTFRHVVRECSGRCMWLFLQPLVRPG